MSCPHSLIVIAAAHREPDGIATTSGIELPGLVLGAFPVLIHALECYREGAEALKDWWHIKGAYRKCRQDLTYHQLLFEGNVERFLLPLVVDDDELRSLMANPARSGWQDLDLEKRLQERLPRSYHLFLDIIRDIKSLMEDLKIELGVDNPEFQAKVNEVSLFTNPNACADTSRTVRYSKQMLHVVTC